MIIQSKKVKKFQTQTWLWAYKKNPIQAPGAQKARAPRASAFPLRTEPDTTEGLRPNHSKLKILKKFPKIKASIPSCDSKLIFFFSLRSKQIKI